jgi:HD-GYP domain-containing protein (c-di-GMP phosphodiesterase class II)
MESLIPTGTEVRVILSMSPPSNSVQVPIDQLRSGARLSHSILDADDVLLLASGEPITDLIKKRLADRGIAAAYLHPDDAARMMGASIKPGPSAGQLSSKANSLTQQAFPLVGQVNAQLTSLATRVSLVLKNVGPPLKNRQRRATNEPYDLQQRDRLVIQFATTKKLMGTMIRHAMAGLSQDTRAVMAVAKGALAELVQDADQTIATTTEMPRKPEITERAVRMSVLGMAIALELDWDEEQIREIGQCGLIHDWGFFRLTEDIRPHSTALDDQSRKEMKQHPLHTFELLGKMQRLSDAVRVAAAQVHEKLDGSGYPLGLKEEAIHPYAKVLHVADAYVSLTEETWGRPAFIPYDAMVYLLSQVRTRSVSIDAVRALLNVVALFPIGSHVELSDGSEARVIRRGKGVYTEPVVQRVGADRTLRIDANHSSIVDLSQSDLRVTAPLPHPIRQEGRIIDTSTIALLWE